jgi:hypothetical protein
MTTRGVAAVVAALLLAGCGASGKPHEPAASSATTTQSTQDTAFLTRVRATVTGGDDAGIIKAGHDSCDAMGKGATALDAAERLTASGFSTQDAATIVAAADVVYC